MGNSTTSCCNGKNEEISNQELKLTFGRSSRVRVKTRATKAREVKPSDSPDDSPGTRALSVNARVPRNLLKSLGKAELSSVAETQCEISNTNSESEQIFFPQPHISSNIIGNRSQQGTCQMSNAQTSSKSLERSIPPMDIFMM